MRGVLASAALAAVALAGLGSATVVAADGARELRQTLERQDRSGGPGAPLGPMERLAARMRGGGGWTGGPGGYRKRPCGTHKQNRRKALAVRGRR